MQSGLASPMSLMQWILLAANDGAKAPPESGPLDMLIHMLPFLAIGLLFYFLIIRAPRQEQNRRQTMLAAIKEKDHVVTSGGIYGVVTNVRRDPKGDVVTLRIDESNNTKIRVSLASIATILGDESEQS